MLYYGHTYNFIARRNYKLGKLILKLHFCLCPFFSAWVSRSLIFWKLFLTKKTFKKGVDGHLRSLIVIWSVGAFCINSRYILNFLKTISQNIYWNLNGCTLTVTSFFQLIDASGHKRKQSNGSLFLWSCHVYVEPPRLFPHCNENTCITVAISSAMSSINDRTESPQL